tara:strand:+ start:6363 stop:7061 length:699 start_codon:yes stop_codon:yes gene_type:complete
MDGDTPKWMMTVPTQSAVRAHPKGSSVVQLTAEPYQEAGFDLLFLVRHQDTYAARILSEMFDCAISTDPIAKVGRGGALRHAWNEGLIQGNDVVVIHNPDDVVLNNITPYEDWLNRGADTCFARCVHSFPHPYTTFDANRHGKVTRVTRQSRVWRPLHVGITVLTGAVANYIPQLPDEPCDFEALVFPRMARREQLFLDYLDGMEDWYPCNDKKTLDRLCETVRDSAEDLTE